MTLDSIRNSCDVFESIGLFRHCNINGWWNFRVHARLYSDHFEIEQSDLCTQNMAAVPCDTTSNEVHICALCCKMYEYWMVVKFGLVRAIDNASG